MLQADGGTRTAGITGRFIALVDAIHSIKKQLPDSKFFICDDDDNPYDWREVTKSELIDLVWKYYEQEKEKMQNE